jgi:DNA-binding beta-propeller fold protein YncE
MGIKETKKEIENRAKEILALLLQIPDDAVVPAPTPTPTPEPTPTPTPTSISAVLLGKDGRDFTDGAVLGTDGKIDVHIALNGILSKLKKIKIRDGANQGAFWTEVGGANFIVFIQHGEYKADLYFTEWKDYPSYFLDCELENGSKFTIKTGETLPQQPLTPPTPTPVPDPTPTPTPTPEPPVINPTASAEWFALPVSTAPNKANPLMVLLKGVLTDSSKTTANIGKAWVYQLPNKNSWWIYPTPEHGSGTIIPTASGSDLILWITDREPGVPVVEIGVEILWKDGSVSKWEIYWEGQGATGWPIVGNGSVQCPVVSIMQHPPAPAVTTQYAHLIRGIEDGRDFLEVLLDIGDLPKTADAALKVRYTVDNKPVSEWLFAKNPRYTLKIESMESFANGQYALSFELNGPGMYKYTPNIAQMHLARKGYPENTDRPISDPRLITQDPTNIPPQTGYAIIKEADTEHAGRPIPSAGRVYAKWGATKPPEDLFAESVTPCDTLFKSMIGMAWDRRTPNQVTGKKTKHYMAWPPKHGEAVLDMNPQWIKSNAEPWHFTFPSRGGYYGPKAWMSNYSQFAGIKDAGWIGVDTSGNVWYIERDGKMTILAGWEVSDDSYPIWPLAGKVPAEIRKNMTLRGSGLPVTGLGTLVDVAINPTNTNECLITDATNHCVWKVKYDNNNPSVRGTVSLFAGTPGVKGNKDGSAVSAQFSVPFSVCYSPDGKYVAVTDQENDRIAIVDTATMIVSTFRQTPAMRTKYGKTTPPWDIRAAESLTGTNFIILDPMFIRWNRKGEIVFSDRGTSTIRAVGFTSKSARLIINDENYRMDVGGWMAFDLDWQGNGNDIYSTKFTGSLVDDTTVTRQMRTLNESFQYIPDDGSNKQYPIFKYDFAKDWRLATTIGRGTAKQTIAPHYGWSLFVHPNGAIIANGGGTQGTTIWTMPNGRVHPKSEEISFDLYRKGVPNRLTPPIFTFGTGGCLIPNNYDQNYVASKYADWSKMTAAEKTLLMKTIDFMFGRI